VSGRAVSGRRGRGSARDRAPEKPPEDPAAYARGLVLGALSRSARTRGQLADLLARKGVEPELAEEVLERYAELGLVDDAAYAEAFTRSRHEHKGLGSRAIAFELRRRSVPDQLVQEAVSVLDAETEQTTASRLAVQRQARMAGLPREVQARRLAGFLARKGYGGEVVGRAVREALAAADEAGREQGGPEGDAGDGFDPGELEFSGE
jgi:regulatory protein